MIKQFTYKLSADDLEDALQILIDVNSLNVKLLLDELIAKVN